MGDFGTDVTTSVQPKADNQPPEVFCKKNVFLKISQISQEVTCVRVSF